jgi:hypothetical protein
LITFCSSQFIIKKTALWHPLERAFMSPVSVWGGNKMKKKFPRPLAFEPRTAQAGSLGNLFFFDRYLPLQKFTRLDGMQ